MLNKQTGEDEIDREVAQLFQMYRESLPDHDASANFMPELWQKIESRQRDTHFFTRMSRALVTAALAASVLLGILLSAANYQSISYFNGTYIEALTAEHNADLELLHPDRIAELGQQ